MAVYTFQGLPVLSDCPDSEPQSISISHLTGLVGRNGAGKTRLLARLNAIGIGAGAVGYLPQIVDAGAEGADVATMLGIGAVIASTDRLSSGKGTQEDFELLESQWHIPEKARALLDQVGLSSVAFDRPEATLSGGPRVLVRFVAVVLRDPDLLLLDEPTNNLDRTNRQRLTDFLLNWNGPALIASHDRDLLSVMSHIIEIERGRLVHYGGGFDLYWSVRNASFTEADRHRELARREIAALAKEKQVRSERAARRAGTGKKQRASGSQPKVAADWKKNRAEAGLGRTTALEEARQRSAETALEIARGLRQRGDQVTFMLDHVDRPAGNSTLDLVDVTFAYGGQNSPVIAGLSLQVVYGDRIAIDAGNGAGKSTLLRLISGDLSAQAGAVYRPAGRIVLIDQHCRHVDRRKTVLEQFRNLNIETATLRQGLAQFLSKGDILDRKAGELSGGELLRLGLASVFVGQSAPVLLLLDEPTNHADLETIEVMERALSSYAGTLIVASHDLHFRHALGLQTIFLEKLKS